MTKEQANTAHSFPSVPSAADVGASLMARTADKAKSVVRTAHSWVVFWTTL